MKVFFLVLHSHVILYIYPQGDIQAKKIFGLSWPNIKMSYRGFNDLAKLLNGDLAAKIGWGILFVDVMDKECNSYIPSKVNGECV